jgi:hypothetical protein
MASRGRVGPEGFRTPPRSYEFVPAREFYLSVIGVETQRRARTRRGSQPLCIWHSLKPQIALFVTFLLVLLSEVVAPRTFDLAFSRAEMPVIAFSIFMVNAVVEDGRSALLPPRATARGIHGIAFHFVPNETPNIP